MLFLGSSLSKQVQISLCLFKRQAVDMDDLRSKLSTKTKCYIVTRFKCSRLIQPVKEIAKLAHQAGAYMVVDARSLLRI